MYVCTYERMYVCTYVRKYVCTYVRTYVCTYVCMYVQAMATACHKQARCRSPPSLMQHSGYAPAKCNCKCNCNCNRHLMVIARGLGSPGDAQSGFACVLSSVWGERNPAHSGLCLGPGPGWRSLAPHGGFSGHKKVVSGPDFTFWGPFWSFDGTWENPFF